MIEIREVKANQMAIMPFSLAGSVYLTSYIVVVKVIGCNWDIAKLIRTCF